MSVDFSKRRLCPDGACLGVLDDDGRCGECAASDGAGAPQPHEPVAAETERAPGDSAFDANRRLCEDGSCVGVVGADGRCGVCGLAAP